MEQKIMKTGWKMVAAAVLLAMVLVLGGMVWPETATVAKASSGVGRDLNAEDITITLDPTNYTYNGSAQAPTITVKEWETTLTKDSHYTVTYQRIKDSAGAAVTEAAIASAPTNAGTYKTIITGQGDYSGTVEKEFTISKATPVLNGNLTATAKYGDALSTVSLNDQSNPTGVGNDGELSGTWTWVETDTTPVGNAGTQIHQATFTPESGNYEQIRKNDGYDITIHWRLTAEQFFGRKTEASA